MSKEHQNVASRAEDALNIGMSCILIGGEEKERLLKHIVTSFLVALSSAHLM